MGNERFSLRAVLDVGLTAAIEAGNYFKSRAASELVVKTKSSLSDLVTDVDPHCEQLIRERIRTTFPDHEILGEESVEPGRDASIAAVEALDHMQPVWIVDPLDGTTNYVNRIPLSVVSIAFADQGQVQVGIVYDPYRSEIFFSIRGQGAYLASAEEVAIWLTDRQNTGADVLSQTNTAKFPGTRLQASSVGELRRAIIATGLPMRHRDRAKMMLVAAEIIRHAKSLRTLGAAALHMAYVAAGRIDAFWEFELNAWDVAAGVLLIEEAGGYVASLDKTPYSLYTRDILSAGKREVAEEIASFLSSED